MNSDEIKELMNSVRAVRAGEKTGADCGFPASLVDKLNSLSDEEFAQLESLCAALVEVKIFHSNKVFGLVVATSVAGKMNPEMLKSALSERSLVNTVTGAKPDIQLDGARLFYKRGQKAFSDELFPKAKNYFARAVEIAPHYREAWFALAGTCELLGFSDEAAAAFERAHELSVPNKP